MIGFLVVCEEQRVLLACQGLYRARPVFHPCFRCRWVGSLFLACFISCVPLGSDCCWLSAANNKVLPNQGLERSSYPCPCHLRKLIFCSPAGFRSERSWLATNDIPCFRNTLSSRRLSIVERDSCCACLRCITGLASMCLSKPHRSFEGNQGKRSVVGGFGPHEKQRSQRSKTPS